MERSNIRHYNLRLNYNNPDHVEIIDILDDLNLEVHKSKNHFICKAIEFYAEAVGKGDLTNAGGKKQEEEGKQVVTRNELEQVRAQIFAEVYREMFRTLGSGNMPRADPKEQPDPGHVADSDGETEEPDISEKLSQYDNVLAQVMRWGED